MAKKIIESYFVKHRKELEKIVKDYRNSLSENSIFSSNEFAIFKTVKSGITKFPLRYYQEDALYTLDHLLKLPDTKQEKKELIEKVGDDKKKIPFLGFEMATGSGKTLLMGACIYLLNQKYGVDNFLIITPSSTDIYYKTIRNFTIGNYESIWADDTPFSFNLITGDNYTQNLFYDSTKDANIFIFNISKFGTNATNSEKTWESAIWQDDDGNSISVKQFLTNKKLIIITDEAHHAQTTNANKIIKNFMPDAVLEFTATAVETEKSSDKKNQTVVYKYDIRRFLEDGYGKLVRAVALATSEKVGKSELNDDEKLKLVTLFLVHLVKKKSVMLDEAAKSLKPVAFIKVKSDTIFTKKVYDYIVNDLYNDLENIQIILDKVSMQDLEITNLINDLFQNDFNSNVQLLCEEISKIAKTSIFYYGESDKETADKFNKIRTNEVEVVIYMQKLDEGIDLPNIYTMAVINDNVSDFKTSVKQIIGRGVRLNKENREYDNHPNPLKANSEKLHIICDQGKNFEEVILSVQKEFGLSDKYLSFDREKEKITNNLKPNILNGLYLPHIKADYLAKQDVELMSLIKDIDTIVNNYIRDNCFEGENDHQKRFLKFRPDAFFMEVDIFSDKTVYHKQLRDSGGQETKLILTDKEIKDIYAKVQKQLHCLPDTITTRTIFKSYIDRFNEIELKYYNISDSDESLAKKNFCNSFSIYYRYHIEKNYFNLNFRQLREDEAWHLAEHFKDVNLLMPKDQIQNNSLLKVNDKQKLIDLIDNGYHFYGYSKSIYDYDKFDSYPEKLLADYLDKLLLNDKDAFWVRNQRNVHFSYGSRKYFPDFLMYYNNTFYVIEAKGEIFADTKKNALLYKLSSVEHLYPPIEKYQGVLVYSNLIERMGTQLWTLDELINESENEIARLKSRESLVNDPPVEDKYKKFLPVFTPINAYKKFVKNNISVKEEGWFDIGDYNQELNIDYFIVQTQGDSLSPKYNHKDWIIMKKSSLNADILNKLVLIFHPSITDDYQDGFTIRKLNTFEEQVSNKLFKEKVIMLEALNNQYHSIKLVGTNVDEEVQVVGVEK